MKYWLFIIFTVGIIKVNAQTTTKPIDTFSYVEQMPTFSYNMRQYLAENIHYPDSAIVHNIEGRIVVKFVVNEDGHISDCEVIKGIDKDCDEEALRVVKSMPRWNPGMQDGKAVKVYFNQPIVFKLEDPIDKISGGILH
jgi:protein TonB